MAKLLTTEERAAISEKLIALQLREHGIDSPKEGKPFCCINPNHRDSNPSCSTYRNKDGVLRIKCFACGLDEDGTGLLGLRTGLKGAALFLQARRLAGLPEPAGKAPSAKSSTPKAKAATAERPSAKKKEAGWQGWTPAANPPKSDAAIDQDKQDAKRQGREAYIERCAAHLTETDYLLKRGLSYELLEAYRVGYDPERQLIVIPTQDGSLVTRTINPNADKHGRYRKAGAVMPFNFGAFVEAQTDTSPVFITEGELDALSVLEVGAQCVGLGSAGGAPTLLRLLADAQRRGLTVKAPVVLILDDDEPGRKATAELLDGLRRLKIAAVEAKDFYRAKDGGSHHDANQYLTEDKDGFIKALEAAEFQAELAAKAKETETRENYFQETRALNFVPTFWDDCLRDAGELFPTGFPKLDERLDGGFFPGLVILGAVSSAGKTTFLLQAADQAAERQQDVLFFSLEMARSELMAKTVSRMTKQITTERRGDPHHPKTTRGILDGRRWGRYSPEEHQLMQDALDRYRNTSAGHMFIIEGAMYEGGIGVPEIAAAVQRHIEITGKKPLVVIDYLQLLKPHDDRATDKQNTDRAVLGLKKICTKHGICVVTISSLNRGSYKDPVNMASFKESGAIEYSADILLGLNFRGIGEPGFNIEEAKDTDPRMMALTILKNRNGETGKTVNFTYYPRFNWYVEDN